MILAFKTRIASSTVYYFTIYFSFLWLQNYAQTSWTNWTYLYWKSKNLKFPRYRLNTSHIKSNVILLFTAVAPYEFRRNSRVIFVFIIFKGQCNLSFQPLLWEYLWCLSLPASFLALRAIKHNCVKNISYYIKWIILLGVLPVVYAFFNYLPDVYTFITEHPTESIQLWRVSIACTQSTCLRAHRVNV